jgi:Aromatic-ring-opening dioxygenase LigAB, LigA subunit
MSVYQVNKILYLTDNDPEFRKRMLANPEAVLNEFRLTAEERDALTSGAVGKLYQMGVHTFLLNHLYRYELFGVNRDNYLERIREGMPYDPRFELGNMPVQRFVKPAQ